MTIGLTGQLATSSVNADGLILKYYGKLDPKTSSGYTTKTPKTSVSGYSSKTPKNTTGYNRSDVSDERANARGTTPKPRPNDSA